MRIVSIGDKIKHVLSSRQDRQHTCHWPNCGRQVKPAAWGCKKHWFMLPLHIRRSIWSAYKIGQEDDFSRVSREYLDLMKQVQIWISQNKDT